MAILIASGVGYALIVKRHFDVNSFYILINIFHILPAPILIALSLSGSIPNPFLSGINYDAALMIQGLIYAIHMFGLVIGYILLPRAGLSRATLPYFNIARHSHALTYLGLCLMTVINFLIIIVPLSKAGGMLDAVNLIREGFYFQGFNFLRIFLAVGTFLCGAQFAQALRDKSALRWSVLAGGIFVLNLIFTAFLGGKGFIVFPVIFFVFALFARQFYKHAFLVFILFLGFAGMVTGLQHVRGEVLHARQSESLWDHAYVGLRFRLFEDNLVYLATDGDLHQTELGEDFINGLLGPVPRSIWPGKPQDITAGGRFKRQIAPEANGGWPPYGFNQWYTNFGWVGVLIGGFLTGMFLRALQYVYRDYVDNPYSCVFMMTFLIWLMIPGGIDNMFLVEYIFFILPLFVFARLTDKRLYETPDIAFRTAEK